MLIFFCLFINIVFIHFRNIVFLYLLFYFEFYFVHILFSVMHFVYEHTFCLFCIAVVDLDCRQCAIDNGFVLEMSVCLSFPCLGFNTKHFSSRNRHFLFFSFWLMIIRCNPCADGGDLACLTLCGCHFAPRSVSLSCVLWAVCSLYIQFFKPPCCACVFVNCSHLHSRIPFIKQRLAILPFA